MLDERDRRLLAAIDHIGPVSTYAMSFHVAADAFAGRAELEERAEALAAEGLLRGRTLPGVTGDSTTEYETVEGWAE